MSLKYSLIPNHLTDDPGDYMAVVEDQKVYELEDIIDIMIARGSTVTRAEAMANIEEFEAAVEQILLGGDKVKTGLFRTGTSIGGVYNDEFDRFDPARHYKRFHFYAGPRIRGRAAEVEVEKTEATLTRPVLKRLKDFTSGTENEALTPGGTAELRGSHLKVDPADASQGIWFLGADDTETKVELIMRNMPSHLMFEVPAGLTSGEYDVEVRTLLQGHSSTRSGRMNASLVVP